MRFYSCLLLITFTLSLEAKTVRICYEQNEMLPYAHGEGQVVPADPGPLPALIKQASVGAKLDLTLYRRPWKRCILDLEQDQADGIFPLIWTAERQQWAEFPRLATGELDPERYLWESIYAIFVQHGATLQWDGERFSQLKSGVASPPGYVAQQKLNQLGIRGPQNIPVQKGLLLVALGRLDGYVIDRHIGDHLIHTSGLSNRLTTLPSPFMSSKWYLALSKRFVRLHPDEAQALWNALEKVRNEQAAAINQLLQLPATPRGPANRFEASDR